MAVPGDAMSVLINLCAQLLYVVGLLVAVAWLAFDQGLGSAALVLVIGAVAYPLVRVLFPLPRSGRDA